MAIAALLIGTPFLRRLKMCLKPKMDPQHAIIFIVLKRIWIWFKHVDLTPIDFQHPGRE